jgi:soluble lytic murein transglycosylase-like protein
MNPPACADVWGYLDADGIAHFATTRVDERYQLFFKGASSLDPPMAAPDVKATPLDESRHSKLYLRLTGHPNVKRYDALIESQAKAHALEPALVKAVIAVESAFEPGAVSPKGARGLMQVIPDTAARYGLASDRKRTIEQKLLDPDINVRIGTRYLRDLLALFSNDLTLALAAYNAGEGAVQRYDNKVPPFPETQEYVSLVRQLVELYRPPPPPPPAKPVSKRVRVDMPTPKTLPAAPSSAPAAGG